MKRLALMMMAAAALQIGCTADTNDSDALDPSEPDGPTGTVSSEIRNGMVRPAGEAQMVALRMMVAPMAKGCSGQLVRNRFVLTARHCVHAWSGTYNETASPDPSTFFRPSLIKLEMGGQQTEADLVFWHPSTDVAVVRAKTPFQVNGSTTGYVRNVRTSYVWAGEWVHCYGYGLGSPNGAFGTLRYSHNMVTSSWGTQFTIASNGSAQITMGGDSGGACFSGSDIAGIQVESNDLNWARLITGSAFNPWLQDILNQFGSEAYDGLKIRDASGRILVFLGDGAVHIQSGYELGTYWWWSPTYQTGPIDEIDPKDGTLLREPNGAISVVYAGAAFHIPSMNELYAMGYATWPVKTAPTNARLSVGLRPNRDVLLRDRATGEIDYVTTNGTRYWLQSWAAYQRYASYGFPTYTIPSGGLGQFTYGGAIPY